MKRHVFGLILSVLLLGLPAGGFAQYYNTIYWLQGIPQASYANPALMPQPRFYLGMPGISSLYTGAGNSGFALRDFLRKDEMDDFYWDEDYLISKLKKANLLDANVRNDLLAFGFRSNRNYLSFNITERAGSRFGYPGDFFRLMLKGNDYFMQQNQPADFSGLGLDFSHYREFGMSFSREWTDRLNAGIRFKALQGLSNIWFERSHLSLQTDPENYKLLLNADLLINISSPSQLSPLDSLNSDYEFVVDAFDYLTNFNNLGGAIDIGLSYRLSERFTLAVSALDLGFINWKQGVENFALKGAFEFEGIDLEDFFNSNNENGSGFDNVVDSLKNLFDIEETMRDYRVVLPPQFYASLAFDLSPRHKLGLLTRAEFYNGSLHPSFTFSYNVRPIHAFSMALSYSVIHWSYVNLGAGFNLNLGPLQLYLVTNNFFGGIQPHAIQYANVHLGLNWVFGYRPKKEDVVPSISW